MNIVVLDGYTENPGDLSWTEFEKLGKTIVYDRTNPNQIAERIGTADAVIVNKVPITEQVLRACPGIRYIGVLATGYNVVDVDAAKKRGIPVCNIPAYGTEAVAQMTFALLLEICHHVGAHSAAVKDGEWSGSQDWCFWKYPLIELAGKTMGIIGFGKIGQAVGKLARAFGMKVVAYDECPTDQGKEIGQYISFNQLLSCSDVISLHCPLSASTEEIIREDTIQKMKDGVIFLNTSRGALVKEKDLAQALKTGKVSAAGVDVVSQEPIRADNPLLVCENCLITPHIAWASKESRKRLMDIAAENLRAFLNGTPQNQVNE